MGKRSHIVWGTDMGKLTANEVKAALGKPGTYSDGDGLFLKVSRTGGASWLLRVQHDGKRRELGLAAPSWLRLQRPEPRQPKPARQLAKMAVTLWPRSARPRQRASAFAKRR